ncbi:hypothetical protein RI129_006234 [Pyrocoelia pectoralis]|uniref:MADF domain-containing protein n=1 Tax=Pyrocoelia pectoralis TaxID=417401 RepID=A0AAN7VEY5_9COLE
MWSNADISEFLTLYEEEALLWNPKCTDHKDRNAVHDHWIRIKDKFSMNCSVGELKNVEMKKYAGRSSRHRELNTIIRQALSAAHIPSRLEPNGLIRSDGKRPDGITEIPWINGKHLVWDATCSDTMAPSNIAACSRNAGASANDAVNRKRRTYKQIIDQGHHFVAVSVETLGSFSTETLTFINELGTKIYQTTGEPKSRHYLICNALR